jgi:hypothetical protein
MAPVRMRRSCPKGSARIHLPSLYWMGRDIELGQLVPRRHAADQQGQDDVVALPFQSRAVGNRQKLFRLRAGQPVPQPGSLPDIGDIGQAPRLLPPDHAGPSSSPPQSCGRPRAGRGCRFSYEAVVFVDFGSAYTHSACRYSFTCRTTLLITDRLRYSK